MPQGSVAAQVESKLKSRYGSNAHAIYGTLNKAGLMHGNKVTKKGAKKAKPRMLKHKASPRYTAIA